MQSPRLQCLGRECRAMRKRTKTKMQRQEPFLARRTEKCRMNVSKRNIITIIVASSWKLSCNLMSIELLSLLTERCSFTTFAYISALAGCCVPFAFYRSCLEIQSENCEGRGGEMKKYLKRKCWHNNNERKSSRLSWCRVEARKGAENCNFQIAKWNNWIAEMEIDSRWDMMGWNL